jgi:hypothetical protein
MAIIIEVIPLGVRPGPEVSRLKSHLALAIQLPLASTRRHNTVILWAWPTAIGASVNRNSFAVH